MSTFFIVINCGFNRQTWNIYNLMWRLRKLIHQWEVTDYINYTELLRMFQSYPIEILSSYCYCVYSLAMGAKCSPLLFSDTTFCGIVFLLAGLNPLNDS